MSPDQTVETEVIEKLRRSDPEALSAIYDRYAPLAYSLLLRITRDRGVAEDLLQELFLRIWNRRRDFDAGRGTLGTWLLSIARNLAIDYVRSAQARFNTRLRPIDQTASPSFSYQTSEPESVIDNARAVREAFADLNDNQRKVLELAYFEGFSQTEIAAKLHEPLGTVKSWMRSALGRMRLAVKRGVAQ
jgi:RNA polymerase sigma-70 factor (ECF subfamily)